MNIGLNKTKVPLPLGISLLEFSLCFILLTTILMLASGLWDFTEKNNTLTRLVDRYVYANDIGAFHFNRGSNQFELDLEKVSSNFKKNYESLILSQFRKELNTHSDDEFRVEIAFASITTDPLTGNPLKNRTPRIVNIITIGEADIPTFLEDGIQENGEIGFDQAILDYLTKFGTSIAIPNFIHESHQRFFSEAPIIAARAVFNYGNKGFLKKLQILDQPYAFDIKIGVLRTDVG